MELYSDINGSEGSRGSQRAVVYTLLLSVLYQ